MPRFNIQENFPTRTLVSYRTGGAARFFAEVSSEEELICARDFALSRELPYFLIGNGTNVLVSDKGFEGLLIKLGKAFSEVKIQEESDCANVTTGASALLGSVSRKAAARGFSGLHLLSGIPGTIGGAIFMNAGAYGVEISDTCQSVKILNNNNQIEILPADACEFSYRHSIFQTNDHWILSADFKLKKGDASLLKEEIDSAMRRRKQTQPLEFPNAGSAFRRLENIFPGEIIERAGLKGFSIGGAQVSEKHANFIINRGGATASDIEKVFAHVQKTVRETFGVSLSREVIFLGDFS